jgi:3D-(3,5/4)-trihydroxycyclohexane-1,2-dione acylhydrolase (decyclizing)
MNGYGHAWWEVPVAEISEAGSVREAYDSMVSNKKKQKNFLS